MPLDKGGFKAGFLSLREKFFKNLFQNLSKYLSRNSSIKTTYTARLCRFRSAAEKEQIQLPAVFPSTGIIMNSHEFIRNSSTFADDTNEIGQRRAIPHAESYVR
jgi:hypothetical protein